LGEVTLNEIEILVLVAVNVRPKGSIGDTTQVELLGPSVKELAGYARPLEFWDS
jgi:hypothetical protein